MKTVFEIDVEQYLSSLTEKEKRKHCYLIQEINDMVVYAEVIQKNKHKLYFSEEEKKEVIVSLNSKLLELYSCINKEKGNAFRPGATFSISIGDTWHEQFDWNKVGHA
ncbi:MAG TPA: hypothetical protein P5089_02830 [Candidatus Portnoybacteria bacterium]|nr:hypothetical protein [Candidatus Portnoybacteria bacterium]